MKIELRRYSKKWYIEEKIDIKGWCTGLNIYIERERVILD